MARGFGLGATLFGAGVVAGSIGLSPVPGKPHLAMYVAVVGMSATMSGDGPVESVDPVTVVAVLVGAVVLAVAIAGLIIAERWTYPVPGQEMTANSGAARRSGVRRLLRS